METPLEYQLTHSTKAGMIVWMNNHPEAFEEAVGLAISDEQPYSRRAAWLLWSCMIKNDERINRSADQIIRAIPNTSDEQQRDLLIVLRQIDLSEKQNAILFDFAASLWKKTGKKPSVRFNAFRMMVSIAQKHPDLKNEIKLLAQDPYIEPFSSTAKRSIFKMIERMD